MLNIIKNEMIKIWYSKRMMIYLGITTIFIIISCIGNKIMEVNNVTGLNYPIFMLGGLIDLVIPIFLVLLIVDMTTEEYGKGTLKLQLIHPYSRNKFLGAKILTLLISAIVLLMFTMLLSYIFGTIFFGWENQLSFNGEMYATGPAIMTILKIYLLSVIPLMSFGMLIFLITLQFSNSGAAAGITIGILIIASIIVQSIGVIRPYLFNYYFTLFLRNITAKEIYYGFLVMGIYGIISFVLVSQMFKRKDILL